MAQKENVIQSFICIERTRYWTLRKILMDKEQILQHIKSIGLMQCSMDPQQIWKKSTL